MYTEIELQFSRKDFEEIYFRDYQGDYLKSPTTKKPFRNLIISFIVLTLLTLFSIYRNNYGLAFFGTVVFLIFLYIYFRSFTILQKWKREVKKYLDREEKYIKHKIILSDESLSVIQDDKETIEKWANFDSAKISNTHILLVGKTNILIPSKSMPEKRYQEVRAIISEKIK